MTKLFMKNTDKGAGVNIRIYPLDANSTITAPESFTSMDPLNLSFGVALTSAPNINCVGTTNRSGGIIVEGAGYSVTTENGISENLSRGDMYNTLRGSGFRVVELSKWGRPKIRCNGGEVSTPAVDGSENVNMTLFIDGVEINGNFKFNNFDITGNEKLRSTLNEHGIEIEFVGGPA